MAWIIDRDMLAEEDAREGREVAKPCTNCNAVGIAGPYGYKGNGAELLCKFRLVDDDRNVLYYGRCNTDDDENAFGPLDDFGTPNAGCTSIEYLNEKGEWKPL